MTTKVHVYYLLKGAAIELLTLPARTKRYKAFASFIRSKLALSTPTVYHKEEIPKDFDAYIFGSDQIWNPKITKGFDDVYFGLFSSRPEARKIAYAASMETSTLNDEEKEYLGKSLFQMHAIGVRESKLNALLQPLVEQKIQTVADPTILCTRETFDNIAVKPDFQGKYVLVYQVRIMPETLSFAQKLADRIGGKVIQLVSTPVLTNRPGVYNCASPEEFIGWFKPCRFRGNDLFSRNRIFPPVSKKFLCLGDPLHKHAYPLVTSRCGTLGTLRKINKPTGHHAHRFYPGNTAFSPVTTGISLIFTKCIKIKWQHGTA